MLAEDGEASVEVLSRSNMCECLFGCMYVCQNFQCLDFMNIILDGYYD